MSQNLPRSMYARRRVKVPAESPSSPELVPDTAALHPHGSSPAQQHEPALSTPMESKCRVGSLRQAVKTFVSHSHFSTFIYLCIAHNTVTIGLNDVYVERDNASPIRPLIEVSEWAVLGVFTFEMFLKVFAYGFGWNTVGRNHSDEDDGEWEEDEDSGYFASNWNRFDCFIVVMSWVFIPIQLSGASNSELGRLVRILRAARPLRALRSFDGTQDVLKTFPAAVPSMRDGLSLLLFVFVVYAILGINLFGVEGNFHGRCVVDRHNDHGTQGLLQLSGVSEVLCGNDYKCGAGFRCSCAPEVYPNGSTESRPYSYQDPITGDRGCQAIETARSWTNGDVTLHPQCPDFGYTCFNNFAVALFMCFKITTLDGWTTMMWHAQDTVNGTVGWIFFVTLVVIVSFNIINLYVAVISGAYRRVLEQRRHINRVKRQNQRRKELRKYGLEVTETMVDAGLDAAPKPSLWQRMRKVFAAQRLRQKKVLNRLAHACRTVTVYPATIDETGCAVQSDLLLWAHDRNLMIKFGPDLGRWTLFAYGGDATAMRAGGGNGHGTVHREGNVVLQGVATDERRETLRGAVLQFERAEEHMNGGQRSDDGLDGPRVAWFDVVVLLCIIANTVCMAMDHFAGTPVHVVVDRHPGADCCDALCETTDRARCPRGVLVMSAEWSWALYVAEVAFSLIFTIELILKVVGLWSLKAHLIDQFPTNLIDAVIVLVADVVLVLDLFLQDLAFNVAVFRLIRIMRAFRLVSRFRRLRLLFNKAWGAFKSILDVLFVLVFWHVLGSLFAMQIFRCEARIEALCQPSADGSCPVGCSDLVGDPAQCVFSDTEIWEHCPWDAEMNFNTFYDGIVLLTFVTTGEIWVSIMQNGMRSTATIWPGLVFFVVFFVVSFYMLYNLFIGVIVQEFELTDEQKEGMQLGYFRVKVLKEIKRKRINRRLQLKTDAGDSAMWGSATTLKRQESAAAHAAVQDEDEEDNPDFFPDEEHARKRAADDDVVVFRCLPPPTPNASLPDAPRNLRAYVRDLLHNRWFDRLVLLAIFVSAIFLAMESPVREFSSVDAEAARTADLLFFCVFLSEFVLKVLDKGLYEHKRAYFRVSWNLLDFVILLFQLMDVVGLSGLGTLRVMRVLRPLRLLNKIKSLQLLLLAMQACAVDMFNVLLLWMFAFIVFAVLGMSLFSGLLYQCNDGDFVGPPINPFEPTGSAVGWRENCAGYYFTAENESGDSYVAASMPTAILKPRVWSNPTDSPSGLSFNFDNFGMALQTIFEVSTFEMWSSVVFACTAVTDINQQPITKNAALNVLYFHAWLVLSCFFVLQLVIGVLVDAINQKSGKALYTALQRNWVQMELRLQTLKPLAPVAVPGSHFRNRVWRFVNYPAFQSAITLVIVLNILLMATESYDQTPWWRTVVSSTNWFFIGVYLLEIVLKLVAYGHNFFFDSWNNFDFAVVVASIVESSVGQGTGLQALRVLRILKVFRTIRLVRRARRLRLIVSALLRSIPHIISSLLLLSLFVFLFAVLGVQLFSGVKMANGIHRRNNFHNAWNGCLLLLRVITGEDWQVVMHDCGIEAPACTTTEELRAMTGDEEAVGDCGNRQWAYVFFDMFYNLGNNVLLNLFVAVLLENFFTLQSNFVLAETHLESYQKIWRDLDPLGRGKLSIWKFRELIEKLHADNNPLGSCTLANEIKFRTVRIELLQDNAQSDEIVFSDVVATLALHVVGAHGLPYAEMLKRQEKLAYFAQLAAVSRMTAMYRSLRATDAREDVHATVSRTPSGASQSRVAGAAARAGAVLPHYGFQPEDPMKDRDEEWDEGIDPAMVQLVNRETAAMHNRSIHFPPGPAPQAAASVAEICLSSLPEPDFERAVKDLDAMLSAVREEPHLKAAHFALKQLGRERSANKAAWPAERPKNR